MEDELGSVQREIMVASTEVIALGMERNGWIQEIFGK